MAEVDEAPPEEAIDIGTGHRTQYREYQGEPAGIIEWHLKPDGKWCRGWVAFHGSKWANQFKAGDVGWNVTQREPLTLTPSILCRSCGSHGFITNGQWVPA
jgi:hypothetical protein